MKKEYDINEYDLFEVHIYALNNKIDDRIYNPFKIIIEQKNAAIITADIIFRAVDVYKVKVFKHNTDNLIYELL